MLLRALCAVCHGLVTITAVFVTICLGVFPTCLMLSFVAGAFLWLVVASCWWFGVFSVCWWLFGCLLVAFGGSWLLVGGSLVAFLRRRPHPQQKHICCVCVFWGIAAAFRWPFCVFFGLLGAFVVSWSGFSGSCLVLGGVLVAFCVLLSALAGFWFACWRFLGGFFLSRPHPQHLLFCCGCVLGACLGLSVAFLVVFWLVCVFLVAVCRFLWGLVAYWRFCLGSSSYRFFLCFRVSLGG